jgi:hypothetical protein
MSVAYEEKLTQRFQEEALTEVRTEHEQYFSALEKHPRLLVGTQVPAIGKEGFETISSTEDAREWQDAVKSILVEEVRERALTQMEGQGDLLATVHSSIELFSKNPDMIPGTKDFDLDLANRFATMLKPYERRDDAEKLVGYSIPVQPIIDNLRQQITTERAAAPAAPAAAAAPAKGRPPAKPADPPQAGVGSKAGTSSEGGDDMSALWGTLGLPNLQL